MYTRLIIFFTLLIASSTFAQRAITPTNSFKIQGKIKATKVFTLAELDTFPKLLMNDQIIYNHKGEIKDTLVNMKGVLLKTLLSTTDFIYKKPKELNAFYFVLIASDGYKVVLSWNEIYNTETGNHFYIVTEMDGKKLKDISQRIIFLSTGDMQAGRRYIKALERIEVKQAE